MTDSEYEKHCDSVAGDPDCPTGQYIWDFLIDGQARIGWSTFHIAQSQVSQYFDAKTGRAALRKLVDVCVSLTREALRPPENHSPDDMNLQQWNRYVLEKQGAREVLEEDMVEHASTGKKRKRRGSEPEDAKSSSAKASSSSQRPPALTSLNKMTELSDALRDRTALETQVIRSKMDKEWLTKQSLFIPALFASATNDLELADVLNEQGIMQGVDLELNAAILVEADVEALQMIHSRLKPAPATLFAKLFMRQNNPQPQ
jgi:hypothetical protein